MKKSINKNSFRRFVRKCLVFGLFSFAFASFVTCNNPIMEKWWPEPTVSSSGGSGVNFAVVLFDTDGASPQPQPIRVLWGENIPRLRAMNKTVGTTPYGFVGWFDERGKPWDIETRKVQREDDANDDGFVTLYARWSPVTFKVTFDLNIQGRFTDPKRLDGTSITVADQYITYGGKIVEPPVIPTGNAYGLMGWFTADNEKWDFENGIVKEDISLHADWDTATRTVHLQVNGGTRPNGQEITRVNFTVFTGYGGQAGGRIIDPGPMAREGYTFAGWYTDLSYTTEWDFITDKVYGTDAWQNNVLMNDYFTLYAKWEPNIYYVTFVPNGGSPAPVRQEVTHGERVSMPPIMSKPSGDANGAFLGWYIELTNPLNPVYLWNFDTDVVKSNMTLYAGWGPITYTVKFHLGNPNGAAPNSVFKAPPDQYVINDGKVTEPFMPPLAAANTTGWSFLRWDYSDDSGIDPSNFNTNNKTARDPYLTHLNPWDFTVPIEDVPGAVTGDRILNLYARWVPPDPDMVWVPRGTFTMGDSGVSGSPAAYHAYPTRQVTLDGFYIGRYEITQVVTPDTNKSYQDVTGFTPSQFSLNTGRPVDRVSWFDAINYCIKLTALPENSGLTQVYTMSNETTTSPTVLSGTTVSPIIGATVTVDWTADGYRLPTEAEWEYAARGGNGSPGNFTYAGSNNPDAVAWYNVTVGKQPTGGTQTVGKLAPNALGIYDMSGNISEWCWDWFDSYKNTNPAGNPLNNPTGPTTGAERVRRGGAWNNAAGNVRSVVRNSDTPGTATWVNGFRVARNPSAIW